MKVTIYTDGAARGNPEGPGGYGTILQYVDQKGNLHEKELSGGYIKTTNNRMELMAVIAGLEAVSYTHLGILLGIIITWILGIICELVGIYVPNPDAGMYSVIPSAIVSFDFSSFEMCIRDSCRPETGQSYSKRQTV